MLEEQPGEPINGDSAPIKASQKINGGVKKKINAPTQKINGKPAESLIFSGPDTASKAKPLFEEEYGGIEPGRNNALYVTIDILEVYHETGKWMIRLDKQKQMPKYYRRYYPEYFPPHSRTKEAKEKREANHAEARQNRQDYETGKRVSVRKKKSNLRYDRSQIVDIQTERRKRSS